MLLGAIDSNIAVSSLTPAIVLVLCVAAGIGTVMMLPAGRERGWGKIGGVVALCAMLIGGAVLMGDHAGAGAYFWIFSAIAIIGAIRVVTHPRPVYSALYFVMTVMASAGLFVLLWAEFMAAALVLIYAGAIMITYVFVIMLAAQATPGQGVMAGLDACDTRSREPVLAAAAGFALMAILLVVIFGRAGGRGGRQFAGDGAAGALTGGIPPAQTTQDSAGEGTGGTQATVQALGTYLFEHQLVNLELAGIILLVSMVGAIVIARRRVVSGDEAFEPTTEMVTLPATPVDDNPHSIPVYGTTNPEQKAYPER